MTARPTARCTAGSIGQRDAGDARTRQRARTSGRDLDVRRAEGSSRRSPRSCRCSPAHDIRWYVAWTQQALQKHHPDDQSRSMSARPPPSHAEPQNVQLAQLPVARDPRPFQVVTSQSATSGGARQEVSRSFVRGVHASTGTRASLHQGNHEKSRLTLSHVIQSDVARPPSPPPPMARQSSPKTAVRQVGHRVCVLTPAGLTNCQSRGRHESHAVVAIFTNASVAIGDREPQARARCAGQGVLERSAGLLFDIRRRRSVGGRSQDSPRSARDDRCAWRSRAICSRDGKAALAAVMKPWEFAANGCTPRRKNPTAACLPTRSTASGSTIRSTTSWSCSSAPGSRGHR